MIVGGGATGGPSTAGSARWAKGRGRGGGNREPAANLSSFQAIATEWLTTTGSRLSGRDGRSRERSWASFRCRTKTSALCRTHCGAGSPWVETVDGCRGARRRRLCRGRSRTGGGVSEGQGREGRVARRPASIQARYIPQGPTKSQPRVRAQSGLIMCDSFVGWGWDGC